MKKFLCLLFVLIVGTNGIKAQSFKETFKSENKHIGFGVHFGAIGQTEDLGLQVLMANLTVYGFYFDIGGWPRSHGDDVRVEEWDDDEAFMFHVGYQLPVTKWLRFVPMVGYAHDATGTTNGHHWTTSNNGINNKFEVDDKFSKFDYGLGTVFNMKHFNIQGTVTRYSWYIGFGAEF